MSQENVEIVRRLLEVYNERSFAENVELIDPEIVWDLSRVDLPDATTHTGRLDFSGFVQAWEEGFVTEHMEGEEMLDAGDRVVVFVRHRGRGRLSGIEIDQTFAMVWTLRDGRAVRMDMYPTRDEALEAVGLSAWAMSQENLEIVRAHFENTNARRFDAAMQGYDPNVELVVSEDVAVDPGVYRGAEAVGEWFGSWFRTFAPGYRLDVVELIPVDDAVVAAVDHRGVGRRSGAEVTTRYYNAYWIRQNRIVRLELFRERSEALAAVRRSEQDGS